jgi:hypothetical protein
LGQRTIFRFAAFGDPAAIGDAQFDSDIQCSLINPCLSTRYYFIYHWTSTHFAMQAIKSTKLQYPNNK